jgi:EAL domain-containing protein (putative c-di-GMP-specific phosphodiesterase class I)
MKTTHLDESSISLNLEITETVVMQNASCSTDIFRDLKALGIRLAVDDFGTGYSSLAYLQRFPVDMLKIDKQFVSHIDTDKDSYAIVKTVVDLSNNLGLAVVAEGVETREQFHLLSEMGCHYAQGYYFSRPVPAEDAEALLASNVSWTTSGN